MPIYGPTGGDFARDTAQYLNRGVAGLGAIGTGLINRAVMREKKRQADIQNLYKTFTDLVNSENYGGNVTKAAKENEELVTQLTSRLFPDDPSTADLVKQGLVNGNQSAQQIAQNTYQELVQQATMDQAEAQQQAQAMNQLATQGRPMPARMSVSETMRNEPASYLGLALEAGKTAPPETPAPEEQAQDAGIPRVDMEGFLGTGMGLEGVEPATSEEGRVSSIAQRQAYDLVQNYLQNNRFDTVPSAIAELQRDRTLAPEVREALPSVANMRERPEATTPTQAKKAEGILQQHQADAQRYQEVYQQTGSHYQTSRQVVGFNEPDIHEAVDQLNQTGEIKNQNVKSFLEKNNLPQTAEGVAQALTYMNTTIMGQPLPKTTDNYGGLGPEAMGRYEELTSMLTGHSVPTPAGTTGTAAPPPAEQLVNSMQGTDGKEYTIKQETADGWILKDNTGKDRFVSKEQALRAGFIQLSPAVESTRVNYELSPQRAVTIEKFLNEPDSIQPKERKLLQSTFERISGIANADLKRPQNRKALREAGNRTVQELKTQDYDDLAIALIDSMPGETFEDRRKALIATSAPKGVQQERQFQELIRQFEMNYDLEISRLELEKSLAAMRYMADRGMQDAVSDMALSERFKATADLMGKVYPNMNEKLLEEAKNDPEKYGELVDEMIYNSPTFKGMNESLLRGIAEMYGLSMQKGSKPLYERVVLPWLFGGVRDVEEKQSATVPEYSFGGAPTGNIAPGEVDPAVAEILRALGQGQ